MTASAAAPPVEPGAVWTVINGFGAYWCAVAAVRLGLFDALASGPRPLAELETTLAADGDRLEVLADALVGLGLLARVPDGVALSPVSDAFLVADRPRSMRDLLVWSPGMHENWPRLDATLRGAVPPHAVDRDGGAFASRLVRATFPTQHAVAAAVAGSWRAGGTEVSRILELGAGAAPWSAAVLDAFPACTSVVNDLPAVLPAAEEELARRGLSDRCTFRPGDYFELDVEPASFDLVVLGHVLRGEGTERAPRLVERAARALRSDGCLVIVDYFLADDHSGPLNALLLGATMMANTEHGRTFTVAECQSWLARVGIETSLTSPVPFQQVVLGRFASDRQEETTP